MFCEEKKQPKKLSLLVSWNIPDFCQIWNDKLQYVVCKNPYTMKNLQMKVLDNKYLLKY